MNTLHLRSGVMLYVRHGAASIADACMDTITHRGPVCAVSVDTINDSVAESCQINKVTVLQL